MICFMKLDTSAGMKYYNEITLVINSIIFIKATIAI